MAGANSFNVYYARIYKERWPGLCAALLQPRRSVALLNSFIDQEELRSDLRQRGFVCEDFKPFSRSNDKSTGMGALPLFQALSLLSDSGAWLPPQSALQNGSGILPYYLLDAASLLPALALAPSPGHRILDMCAAPGGKSLSIAFAVQEQINARAMEQASEADQAVEQIGAIGDEATADAEEKELTPLSWRSPNDPEVRFGSEAKRGTSGVHTEESRPTVLVAIEMSQQRSQRLRAVFKDYLPGPGGPGRDRLQVDVRCDDSSSHKFKRSNAGMYDRVLLDAPCSSDRHVLHDPAELAIWSAKRTQTMAERQVQLLLNAVASVRMGGLVVYSTCSISPAENDGVVEHVMKIVKKKQPGYSLEVQTQRLPFGEPTPLGWIVLPDRCPPWGPLFICTLAKVPMRVASDPERKHKKKKKKDKSKAVDTEEQQIVADVETSKDD